MISVQETKLFDLRDAIARSPVASQAVAEGIMIDCLHRSTEVRVGSVDGVLACVWGIIPPTLLSDGAWLWLLTTDIIAEHKFLFIRNSQRYVEDALGRYPYLCGDVVLGNEPAKRWLKWLGAEFQRPVLGKIPFVIRAKNG